MKVRSKLVGAMLVVMLVLAAYSVPAQKKAAGERRDAVSDIDAGIDKHARQMLETGRRVFRFDTFTLGLTEQQKVDLVEYLKSL